MANNGLGVVAWCDAAPPARKHDPVNLENRLKVYNYFKERGPCTRLVKIEGIKHTGRIVLDLIRSGYIIQLRCGMVQATDKIPKVH
jgi:hypothetical protein